MIEMRWVERGVIKSIPEYGEGMGRITVKLFLQSRTFFVRRPDIGYGNGCPPQGWSEWADVLVARED